MFKITIKEAAEGHRIKLMYVIRTKLSNPQLSVSEVREAVNNLPYTPFISESWMERKDIEELLDGICIYTLEQFGLSSAEYKEARFYEQSLEYLVAKEWYDTLTAADKAKVDLLVNAKVARAH